MLIFPAIDLIDGKCVRLSQGNYDAVSNYANDPLEVASEIKMSGAAFLHIVDLDGARKKRPVNTKTVLKIVNQTELLIQVGGGIRTLEAAKELLENGVERIIIGTAAISDKRFLNELLDRYGPEKIIVSLDFKRGKMATQGWLEVQNVSINETLEKLSKVGVREIVVTDIEKDGMLKGASVGFTEKFVDKGFEVIAAGGVSSFGDLEKLKKIGAKGAIIGKAYYEKKLDISKVFYKYPQSRLAKRIIPCLDVKAGRVVKGTHFKKLKDTGDAVQLGEFYAENGADELVFLDIAATVEERKILGKLVEQVASKVNIPFSVGGGIKTLEDIEMLLNKGADKVSIGSMAVLYPHFVQKAVERFGTQAIVISLDAKKHASGWTLFIRGGTKNMHVDAISFAKKMQAFGAGELLVNSLDVDGTKKGFDINLLDKMTQNVNIPVIASSGAGTMEHFSQVFDKTGVSAALAASVFHFREIEINSLKQYLLKKGVFLRQ